MSEESVFIPTTLTEEEQALLQTGGSSSSSSCSSGCTKKKKTTHPVGDRPRYEWVIDDEKASVKLIAKVDLNFINANDSTNPWTNARMNQFEKDFPNATAAPWNKKAFVLVPKNKKCCPVKAYTPELEIALTDNANAYQIAVFSGTNPFHLGPKPHSYVTELNSLFTGRAIKQKFAGKEYSSLMIENCIKLVPKTSGNPISEGGCQGRKQVNSAHEIGHSFGIDHPGQYVTPEKDHDSIENYEVDSPSLMGCGMELRKHYFEPWRKILSAQRKSCCGEFTIEKAEMS